MSLHTRIQLDVGTARYESQVHHVQVHLGVLPSVNSAKIALPIAAELQAETGTEVKLALDAGNGWEPVLQGKVRGRSFDFESQTLIIADGSSDLSAIRPNQTFKAQEAAAVAKTLCSDANVTLEVPPGPFGLASFAAHGKRTTTEHLDLLAKLTGTLALVNGRGHLQFLPLSPLIPTKALKYGRDFTTWRTQHQARPAREWVAVGHGPAGVVQAPNAMIQTKGTLPSSPSEGTQVVRQTMALLRTPLTAQTTNQGLNTRYQLGKVLARASGIPHPSLRPGTVLEVQDLPRGDHPKNWLVTTVIHRWNQSHGATTQFHAWSTDAGSSLLSALGGLF